MTPGDHNTDTNAGPNAGPSDGPVVGIDLGTTNSLVAVCDERGPRTLTAEDPNPVVPSAVRYSPDGTTVQAVGRDALSGAVEYADRTVVSAKRLMGRSATDAADDLPRLGYAVVEGANSTARVRIGSRDISPQEVSAEILSKLKRTAEAALGEPVGRAVVTVPAYFDDAQRQATRDAGRLAGLEVVRVVNEPTAAALAYGIGLGTGQGRRTPETVAVYDLGGGTFDVSILRIEPAPEAAPDASPDAPIAPSFFQVLSTAGDTRLGGDDIDAALIDLCTAAMRDRFGADLSFPPSTRQALWSLAQAAKVRLSDADTATIQLDLGPGPDGSARVLHRTITREDLESLAQPLVARTLAACARALDAASLTPADIDRVVLVGGSTRMPLVRREVQGCFGTAPYTALDPDRVVALGAAVQASIVAGLDRSALLLDVLALPIGLETAGGGVAKLITANATLPACATETFTTSVDGQTSIKLRVLQGEREMAADCRELGTFHLAGVPPMPAGVPKLLVEFLVDANGVLTVAATEARSGKRAALQVVPAHGLSRQEVAQMEADAVDNAREDMARHRVADLIVNSELDLQWVRGAVQRAGKDVPERVQQAVQAAAKALQRHIDTAKADWTAADPAAFAAAKEALDTASVPVQELAIARSLRAD